MHFTFFHPLMSEMKIKLWPDLFAQKVIFTKTALMKFNFCLGKYMSCSHVFLEKLCDINIPYIHIMYKLTVLCTIYECFEIYCSQLKNTSFIRPYLTLGNIAFTSTLWRTCLLNNRHKKHTSFRMILCCYTLGVFTIQRELLH